MVHVLLICSQGASTAIMCDKIRQEAQKDGVEMEIKAVPLATSSDIFHKLILFTGSSNSLYEKEGTSRAGNTLVMDIDMQAYGMMDGAKVYKSIKENL